MSRRFAAPADPMRARLCVSVPLRFDFLCALGGLRALDQTKKPQKRGVTEKSLLCVSVSLWLTLLCVLRYLCVVGYQEYRNITCVVRMNPPWDTIVPKAELPCTVFI